MLVLFFNVFLWWEACSAHLYDFSHWMCSFHFLIQLPSLALWIELHGFKESSTAVELWRRAAELGHCRWVAKSEGLEGGMHASCPKRIWNISSYITSMSHIDMTYASMIDEAKTCVDVYTWFCPKVMPVQPIILHIRMLSIPGLSSFGTRITPWSQSDFVIPTLYTGHEVAWEACLCRACRVACSRPLLLKVVERALTGLLDNFLNLICELSQQTALSATYSASVRETNRQTHNAYDSNMYTCNNCFNHPRCCNDLFDVFVWGI